MKSSFRTRISMAIIACYLCYATHNVDKTCFFFLKHLVQISVADPRHFKDSDQP